MSAALAEASGEIGKEDAPLASAVGSRREREFFRYAEAVAGLRPSAEGRLAVSSRDLALTAYAQLVTLRLNVKRAMISLFDKECQYILAEATRTLSLQADDVHAPDDALCFGTKVLERMPDFSKQTLRSHRKLVGNDGELASFTVPDLRNDDRYAQHDFVIKPPFARAYTGVPLVSPTGYAVGTVAFLDDKPREESTTYADVIFMTDIATTVVSHLEMARTAVSHSRALRMIKGLSHFVEGKDFVNNEEQFQYRSMSELREKQDLATSKLAASKRTHALNLVSNREREDDAWRSHQFNDRRESTTLEFASSPMSPTHDGTVTHETTRMPPIRQNLYASDDTIHRDKQSISTNNAGQAPSDLQENLLSKDVRESFERAAAIVNQAMDMSGVIFLDASVGEFGRLHSSSEGGTTSAETSEATSSEKESSFRRSRADFSSGERNASERKICRELGSAYSRTIPAGHQSAVLHYGVPERFLKSLIRRFPYGKIWNFDKEGYTSSDDFSDSSTATDGAIGKTQTKTAGSGSSSILKDGSARRDAKLILELFPGARALGVMPMWDANRERFFASAIVWTYSLTRTFSFQEDLNYLGAFCDVIMAEVGRLDAQRDVRAKTSFISSISHELKSPLHGILGGIECLQDKANAALHDEMLQMIDSSGRSLLDVINHLLEHATASSNMSAVSKHGQKSHRSRTAISANARSRRPANARQQPANDLVSLTEEVLDTVLWSTPGPSSYADSAINRPEMSGAKSSTPLKVILEVDSSYLGGSGWNFHINAGAWRRILQNLSTNSIKYTDTGGYLKVILSARPAEDHPGDSTIELTCIDSGRGMSKDYLSNGLWRPFSQEDEQSQGTGLGLSLVHGIVSDMNGQIEIKSSKGVGTVVTINVRLTPVAESKSPLDGAVHPQSAERRKDWRYTLLGFDADDTDGERVVQSSKILRTSIATTCEQVGLSELKPNKDTSAIADIYIITESKAMAIASGGPQTHLESDARRKPCIVLCNSITSSRILITATCACLTRATAVVQPMGPRKLARTLASCMEQRNAKDDTTTGTGDFGLEQPNSGRSNAEAPRPSTRTPSLRPKPSTVSSGLCVLLVDDNQLNLKLLQAYMQKSQHHYLSASNGLEAVDAYKHAYSHRHDRSSDHSPPVPPKVALMDLTMPIMDGLEATRQIRAYERSQGIAPAVIIALTAMGSPEAKQEAFSSGVDLFLTKPVRLQQLTAILADHKERLQIQQYEREAPNAK